MNYTSQRKLIANVKPQVIRDDGQWITGTQAMTLREYYAGLAMQGLLANAGGPIQGNGMHAWSYANCDADTVASFCGTSRRSDSRTTGGQG